MVIVMTIAAVGWPTNRVFTGWAAADTIVGTIVIVAASLANLSGPKRTCRKGAHAKAGAGSVAVAAMGRLSATLSINVVAIIADLARIGTGGAITTSAVTAACTSAIRIAYTAGSCESIIADLIAFNDAIAAGLLRTNIRAATTIRVINAITTGAIKGHGVIIVRFKICT